MYVWLLVLTYSVLCNCYIAVCLHTSGVENSDEDAVKTHTSKDTREFFLMVYDPL